MARYRKIDSRIWNDKKFRGLSDDARMVWFLLLTHPNMTALGGMRASLGGLSEEIGWRPPRFRKAFLEVSDPGMALFDEEASLIALPNFLRYNGPESPNVVKAWSSAYDLLPECALKDKVLGFAEDFVLGSSEAFRKAFSEAFGKALHKTIPNPEPEPEPYRKESSPPTSESPTSGTGGASVTSTPELPAEHERGGKDQPDWDDETVAYLRRNSRDTAQDVRATLSDLGKNHTRQEIQTAIEQARCSAAGKPMAFVGACLARKRAKRPLQAAPGTRRNPTDEEVADVISRMSAAERMENEDV